MSVHRAGRFLGGVVVVTAGLTLGGCSVGTLGGVFGSDAADGPPPAAPAAAQAVDITGRWVLAAQGGSCRMSFAGPPGAREGTIAPEGGCPGQFFTSRRWAMEQSAIVIRNHAGEALAQLAVTEPGRLEGQATSGEKLVLTR